MPGKGRMTVTGNLKDVMKESISAAASYVRSRAVDFGIEPPLFDKRDIHVHVPEGATPKDGPSAGVAMATVIVSMLTGIPVRRDVAMTGEITLRGRVLPIGGLKEKLLAALRGGIKKVLIPEDNAKDLADIPASVKNGLEIVPVSRDGRSAGARAGAQADADRVGGGRHGAVLAAARDDDARGRGRPLKATFATLKTPAKAAHPRDSRPFRCRSDAKCAGKCRIFGRFARASLAFLRGNWRAMKTSERRFARVTA